MYQNKKVIDHQNFGPKSHFGKNFLSPPLFLHGTNIFYCGNARIILFQENIKKIYYGLMIVFDFAENRFFGHLDPL